MDILTLIILSLAVWRLSSLLVNEDGPYSIFVNLRDYVTDNLESELLTCVWCTSVWVAIGITILYLIMPVFTTYLCLPFALSTMAILMDRYSQ